MRGRVKGAEASRGVEGQTSRFGNWEKREEEKGHTEIIRKLSIGLINMIHLTEKENTEDTIRIFPTDTH